MLKLDATRNVYPANNDKPQVWARALEVSVGQAFPLQYLQFERQEPPQQHTGRPWVTSVVGYQPVGAAWPDPIIASDTSSLISFFF